MASSSFRQTVVFDFFMLGGLFKTSRISPGRILISRPWTDELKLELQYFCQGIAGAGRAEQYEMQGKCWFIVLR